MSNIFILGIPAYNALLVLDMFLVMEFSLSSQASRPLAFSPMSSTQNPHQNLLYLPQPIPFRWHDHGYGFDLW